MQSYAMSVGFYQSLWHQKPTNGSGVFTGCGLYLRKLVGSRTSSLHTGSGSVVSAHLKARSRQPPRVRASTSHRDRPWLWSEFPTVSGDGGRTLEAEEEFRRDDNPWKWPHWPGRKARVCHKTHVYLLTFPFIPKWNAFSTT